MTKSKAEKEISVGIYLNPAELHLRAESVKVELITRCGRFQALKIATILCYELKRIQDKPTEIELEMKAKRVDKLTSKFEKLQHKLAKLEGK